MRDGRQFFRGTFDIKFDENFHFGANYYFDQKVYVNICLIELEIYCFFFLPEVDGKIGS
jgi:hypothetical protein